MSLLRSARAIVPAVARVNTALKVQKPLVAKVAQRSFFQSPIVKSTPAATTTPAPEQQSEVSTTPSSLSDIIQKYGGWYPLAGLAGVIAVSKEVFVLNEEFLLVTNFAAMVGTFYLTAGDVISAGHQETRDAIRKKYDSLFDFEAEQLEALITAHQLNVEQVEVLKSLKTEYNELASRLVVAKELKLRHAARDAIMKKLQDAQTREQSESASKQSLVLNLALQYAKRQAANLSKQQKEDLINQSINIVEGKPVDKKAASAVEQIYRDYFAKKLYAQDYKQAMTKQSA